MQIPLWNIILPISLIFSPHSESVPGWDKLCWNNKNLKIWMTKHTLQISISYSHYIHSMVQRRNSVHCNNSGRLGWWKYYYLSNMASWKYKIGFLSLTKEVGKCPLFWKSLYKIVVVCVCMFFFPLRLNWNWIWQNSDLWILFLMWEFSYSVSLNRYQPIINILFHLVSEWGEDVGFFLKKNLTILTIQVC